MANQPCHDSQLLKAWSLGLLEPDAADSLSCHIIDCPVCEETLAGFNDTADSLVGMVRETRDADAPVSPEIAAAAIRRVTNPYVDDSHAAETVDLVAERVGDYELLDSLGNGGMGTVYRARHRSLDRIVAIKLLPARRLNSTQAVERFQREMKAIGRLNHPSIVRATDAGEVDGTHYLAMDFVAGIDLSRLIRQHGPLRIADSCEVIRQAAAALHYAHSQGLIHRDVKPGNLMLEAGMLDGDGARTVTIKVLDLGLALFGSASEVVDDLTTVGQLMGTLDYMAPEQADSSHTVTATADVYSLGATLFKLLTGTAPYETREYKTPLAKMKALSLVDIPSIATRTQELPDALVTLVDNMLVREPTDRPQSAQEVAESIVPFTDGHELGALAELAAPKKERLPAIPVEDQWPQRTDAVNKVTTMKSPAEIVAPVPATVTGRNGGLRRLMAVCVAVGGIALASVIWIQTDKGVLKIESSAADIPIEIRQGDTVTEKLTLQSGTNEVQLQSGRYEVTIPVEYDNVQISNGSVEIRRGSEWLARVTEVESLSEIASKVTTPQSTPDNGVPPPTYQGKTFDEWHTLVRTERSPEELTSAIQALCTLGRNFRDLEAAEAVLDAVSLIETRNVEGIKFESTPETDVFFSAGRLLLTLNLEAVIDATRQRLTNQTASYLIATYLAPRRDWQRNFSNVDSQHANAFWEADRFVASVESNFREAHPRLQRGYLRNVTDRRDEGESLFLLGDRELTIATNAARGTYSEAAVDPALELLVRRGDETAAISALIKQVRAQSFRRANLRVADSSEHSQSMWGSGVWMRWRLLREVTPDETLIAQLSKWVQEERQTYFVVQRQAEERRRLPALEISRSRLAAEVLGHYGQHADSSLPVISDAIAALAGQAPDPSGVVGIVPVRRKTWIPSYGSEAVAEVYVPVLPPRQDARQPAKIQIYGDQDLNDLESLLFAWHEMTGQPVRFQTLPKRIKHLCSTAASIGTTIKWAIPFKIVIKNGRTWNDLVAAAAFDDPITPEGILQLGNELLEFHQGSETEALKKQVRVGFERLLARCLQHSPGTGTDSFGETACSIIDQLAGDETSERIKLVDGLLSDDANSKWITCLLNRYIMISSEFEFHPSRETSDAGQGRTGPTGIRKWSLRREIETGMSEYFEKDGTKRKRLQYFAEFLPSLQRLFGRFDELPEGAQDSLIRCADVVGPGIAGVEFLDKLLESGNDRRRLDAARVLLLSGRFSFNHIGLQPDADLAVRAVEELAAQLAGNFDLEQSAIAAIALSNMSESYWQHLPLQQLVDSLGQPDPVDPAALSIPIVRGLARYERTLFPTEVRRLIVDRRVLTVSVLAHCPPSVWEMHRAALSSLVVPEQPTGTGTSEIHYAKFPDGAVKEVLLLGSGLPFSVSRDIRPTTERVSAATLRNWVREIKASVIPRVNAPAQPVLESKSDTDF